MIRFLLGPQTVAGWRTEERRRMGWGTSEPAGSSFRTRKNSCLQAARFSDITGATERRSPPLGCFLHGNSSVCGIGEFLPFSLGAEELHYGLWWTRQQDGCVEFGHAEGRSAARSAGSDEVSGYSVMPPFLPHSFLQLLSFLLRSKGRSKRVQAAAR